MKSIYIQTIPSEKFALLTEGQNIQQFSVDRSINQTLVGNIYLGRVARIDHGLQSAFIDIGHKKLGFLSKKELPASRRDSSKGIEHIIHEGMSIIVQVMKDPYGNKGPTVTGNITLPGHYLIYLPNSDYLAFSKKILGAKKEQIQQYWKNWEMEKEGAIIRTSALFASEEQLKKEWHYLKEKWLLLRNNSAAKKAPTLLFEDPVIPNRFLRKFASLQIEEIVFDEVEVAQEMKKEYPHLANRIRWSRRLEQELPMSIDTLIDQVTSNRVKLQSGVEIIIEKTEALTVIDVNTASYIGKQSKEETIVKTNILAAQEIARELRLRNLSGIILIDFIDMKQQQNQALLLEEMSKLLQEDPTFTQIHGFTSLGILEMTRKREGLDSFSLFSYKDTRQSDLEVAYQLERELLRYRHKDTDAFLVELDPTVYEMFVQYIQLDKLKNQLKTPVFIEKKTLENRKYVIKFIGDVNWLKRLETNGNTIDKLF